MSILSNSIYGSSTSKGMGGLLSGLDTDELVNQMTAITRNKINKQYQEKQKLLYRQEAYREISTKLLALSNKYFSYSTGSKTNILSTNFFEANTFESSSSYVNVTGNADSIKNFEINEIKTVASAASFASEYKISNGSFSSAAVPEEISRLAGETFSVTYEGKTYNLSISKDFKAESGNEFVSVQEELNKQLAAIKDKDGNPVIPETVKFEFAGDKLNLTGGAYLSAASLEFKAVLNMETGKEKGSSSTESISVSDLTRDKESILSDSNEYITFDYNGVSKTIKLDASVTDTESLKDYLNTELGEAYGEGRISVTLSGDELTFETTGAAGTDILSVKSISRDLSKLTGLKSGDNNRVKKDVAIGESGVAELDVPAGEDGKYSITINDKTLEFAKTATFNDVIRAINDDEDMNVTVSYSTTTDTFTITADETGEHTGVKLQDDGEGSLSRALFGEGSVDIKGTDTEMTYTLNGVTSVVKRSNANFTIDDISIELNKNAAGLGTDGNPPVTFDVTNNVDEVVERVKKFIDEYNEIITLIGTGTNQKPKRKYPPLTPEQQDEMKEEEIKNWTAEAKKGVLYSDPKMMRVLSELRGAMGGTTDTSSLTLASIGISPAYMDTTGKLVLDEDKFKQKLLEDPDEVANLFSGAVSSEDDTPGIAVQLKEILVKNVGVAGTSGLLIEEAGMSNGLTADKNYISEKITDYDEKMEELKKDLAAERQRYWNQFTALEKSLNQLNAQSSWLTNMLGN